MRKTILNTVLGAFLALHLVGCAATRVVKPLEKGQASVGFDFGGPIIDFAGLKIPIPYTSVSGAYGIDSTLTVFGGLHTTALGFRVFQTDLGVVKQLYRSKGERPFGVSVAPIANLMLDGWTGSFRFYPQVDANLYWQYSPKRQNFAYVSVQNWFDLRATGAHGVTNREHYIPNLALGHTFENKTMRYALELKYLAPFSSNRNLVVTYNGIGGQGSLGFYFSVSRKF